MQFWTSGTDNGNEGDYYWSSSGFKLDYHNWRYDEPNNNQDLSLFGENCIVIVVKANDTRPWNDLDCYVEERFICRDTITHPSTF